MSLRELVVCLTLCGIMIMPAASWAAHPLITDDAGTQGKGNFLLEVNGQYEHDKEDGVKSDATEIKASLSYGITDMVDIVFGLPYQFTREEDDEGFFEKEDGIADASVEVKWWFFERGWLKLAIKPGITIPTGDEDKGLGTGKMSYSVFFIASAVKGPGAMHINIGGMRNDSDTEEKEDIWHASVAGELEVVKDLKAVANIGIERNPDPASHTDAAFILGGLIYALTESLSVDIGIKGGLTDPEADCTVLAGMAWTF